MPFNQPFKEGYQPGDLVYGLHEQRDFYAKNFPHIKLSLTPTNISTIDQYAATNVEIQLQGVSGREKSVNQDDYLRVLSAHKKYGSIRNAEGFKMGNRAVHHHKVIGQKCKAGLYWVSNLKDQTSIHFILDKIDMNLVVQKSHPHDQRGRAYTGVELRWLYRNRHNPLVMEKIQFWLNGSPTPPPWIGQHARLWQQYKPHFEPGSFASLSPLFDVF